MDSALFNTVSNDAELMYINPLPDPLSNHGTSYAMPSMCTLSSHANDSECIGFGHDLDNVCLVSAPPPSPQEPSMLDSVFEEQLQRSLQTERRIRSSEPHEEDNLPITFERRRRPSCVVLEHAQTLDRLLRKTQQEKKHIQKTHRNSRLKTKSLCNLSASELADAISLIQLSNGMTSTPFSPPSPSLPSPSFPSSPSS